MALILLLSPIAQPGKSSRYRVIKSCKKTILIATRKKTLELVFVSMDGHFTVEPTAEEGLNQKSLMADSNVKFDASKACP